MGKAGNSRDPSAIGVGGRETGIMDVVEAVIKKRVPDRIISDVIEMQREYCCIVWGFESVQFQEFLRTELVKRSALLGLPVPARALIPTSDKVLRIESLQPHMHNGLIRVHSSQINPDQPVQALSQSRPRRRSRHGADALHALRHRRHRRGNQGHNNPVQSAQERYARKSMRMFRRNR